MTEVEWLACNDPTPMLEFLRGKATPRQLLLFAVGGCRRVWHLLDAIGRRTVETSERFADAQASRTDLIFARDEIWYAFFHTLTPLLPLDDPRTFAANAAFHTTHFDEDDRANEVSVCIADALKSCGPGSVHADLADAIRCIVGPLPFRPAALQRRWLTPTVISIATAAYQERKFDGLPVLADAFEDAGCTNAAVLDHCRQPGEHVRGCWVVDLVLGKS